MTMVPNTPPKPPMSRWRAALSERVDRMRENFDSWVNPLTGFGTTRDKTTYGYIQNTRILTDEELSALYHSDDMAARMVDVVPQEMLREGFFIETGDPKLNTQIADKMTDLDVRGKVQEAVRWARCFGGAALLLGVDDGQNASEPLKAERAKDMTFLYVIDRRLLWPISWYNDPGDPKLGQVKSYMVTTIGGQSYTQAEVHESRLVVFRGAPTGNRERLQISGWDYSVLQRAYDTLRQFNTSWRAVEQLLTDGNQAIFKMSNLAEILGSPGGDALVATRMQAMDMARSVIRAMVIDADGKETFERQAANFGGIPDMLDKFTMRLSATVQIPQTILMGQSPAGMNATGESDFRWFYDRIRAEQTTMLAPKIKRIVDVWGATKVGRSIITKMPEITTVKFPALWTETPLAQAQRESAIATRDSTYITAQVLLPDEVALARFRPEGFDNEIQLTDESKRAREAALAADLKTLTDPAIPTPGGERVTEEPEPPPNPGAPLDDNGQLSTVTGGGDMNTAVNAKPLNSQTGNRVDGARFDAGKPHVVEETTPTGAISHMFATKAEAMTHGMAMRTINAAVYVHKANSPFRDKNAVPATKEQTAQRVVAAHTATAAAHASVGNTSKAAEHAKIATANLAAGATGGGGGEGQSRDENDRWDAKPRTFRLIRHEDVSGASGTGEVFNGCVFTDGKVAGRWNTPTASTELWDSVEDMMEIHGHGGATELRYDDEQRSDAKPKIKLEKSRADRFVSPGDDMTGDGTLEIDDVDL